MKDLTILKEHWALVVSLGTVFGLVAAIVRAYRVAHGSSGYLLLLSGEHLLNAAIAIGLEALLLLTAALIFILVPTQFAYSFRETSAPTLLISLTGIVVLIVAQVLEYNQLLVVAIVAVVVAIVIESLLVMLFRRLDVRSPAEVLKRIEGDGPRLRRRRKALRTLKAKGRKVSRRKKSRGPLPALDSELGQMYQDTARRFIVVHSGIIAFVLFVSTLLSQLNPWIPIEQLTLTSGIIRSGVMVVEEDGRWMTIMDVETGEFSQLKAHLVENRDYCRYSIEKGSIAVEC